VAAKRVLSVGQCAADNWSISRFIRKQFDADVVTADSLSDALDQLRAGGVDLVLVNRVFDADGSSGMEMIKQIQADAELRSVPVMLVSNYEEPQRQAVEMGAAPGFGKGALGHPQTVGRLKVFLE
jgi:two-component system, chemotaxis family, chemotaxis protein CheY